MTTPFPVLAEMSLPSPVRRLESFGNGNELWLKDDSHIHPIYGGNKCRKLARLLRKAAQKGARQVVTFGAAGSHHVLATSLLAQASGFSVRAFVVPQPWTAHAEQVLRASVASGAELLTLKSWVEVLQVGTQLWSSGTLLIPPGGSNISGSLGYFDAALELAVQIERGELPEPDTIVVPFGTTGTAAGLLAGLEYSGLKSKVVGVSVLRAPARAGLARAIADAILRELNERGRARRNELVIDSRWVGRGYGFETDEGRGAAERAQSLDLPLDPSYTAKAFAAAWALGEGRNHDSYGGRPIAMPNVPQRILYWHTLSAPCSLQSESDGANPVPVKFQQLLRPCPAS